MNGQDRAIIVSSEPEKAQQGRVKAVENPVPRPYIKLSRQDWIVSLKNQRWGSFRTQVDQVPSGTDIDRARYYDFSLHAIPIVGGVGRIFLRGFLSTAEQAYITQWCWPYNMKFIIIIESFFALTP